MGVEEIVNVSISQNTQAVTQAGFGVPLIVGTTPVWAERVRYYSGIAGVAADFATTDNEYKAASAIFSQTPRPPRIAIGRRSANVAAVWTLVFDADLIVGNTVNGKVNGNSIPAVPFNTSHLLTMGDLATAVAAEYGVATAVVGGAGNRTLTVTADLGYQLSLSDWAVTGGASQANVAIATPVAGLTVADELDDIQAETDDWYSLNITSRLDGDIWTAAAWTEARRKKYTACNDSAGVLAATAGNILDMLNGAGYHRTHYLYSGTPGTYPESSWDGRCLPLDPGSETWAYKDLVGQTPDALTETQSLGIRGLDDAAPNGNTFEVILGARVTRDGTMVSGRFIDQTRFIDQLEAWLQQDVFALLVNNPKIPYTDAGVAQVEGVVRAALQRGVDAGGLDADFTVTVPKVADVPLADRAIRKLPGVTFTARLQGAIHKVVITGTVTV